METTISSPFSSSDAGCWYDSHRGYESIAREVIFDALNRGMKDLKDPDGVTYEEIANCEDLDEEGAITTDDLHWAEEAAENFLNALAPEGFWIGWQDGDFGMWEIEEEESC